MTTDPISSLICALCTDIKNQTTMCAKPKRETCDKLKHYGEELSRLIHNRERYARRPVLRELKAILRSFRRAYLGTRWDKAVAMLKKIGEWE